MKAFIQADRHGDFYNVNAFLANEGFRALGWETAKYVDVSEIQDPDPEILVVGGIGNVRRRLDALGIAYTRGEIDYPEELLPFLGRRVWASTLEEVFRASETWNLFMKPRTETKKFPGKVFREYKDFTGLVDFEQPTEVWCSEVLHFETEWRCFIRYGEIFDVRRYNGSWNNAIDTSVVQAALEAYRSKPNACALDFGMDSRRQMFLVEVNDGHSLGSYGMGSVSYARFLSARWAQLTGTRDYLYF